MTMKTVRQWLKDECEIEMPHGCVNGEWFFKHNLPMVVECCCCWSTMSLFSAMIDEDGNFYCSSCAGDDDG